MLLLEGTEAMVTHLAIPLLLLLPLLQMVNSDQRSERQAPLAIPASNVTVPVALTFYNGTDAPALDDCPRNQVKLANGICYQLLTRGPCLPTHYIVLDPITNRAYCGPRLCAPDRIFVFSEQLCYDPRDSQLCPEGRQLYQTSFGTPVCQCPDGTYETEDDDQDDRDCEPLLAASASCPMGQVLWFRNFSSRRECLNDPCDGENLRRPLQEHLLVPSAEDGKCYPIGQRGGICPAGTWFTLALNQLQGVCSKLEDAGYLILGQEDLTEYEEFYGPALHKDIEENSPEQMSSMPMEHQVKGGHNASAMQETILGQGPIHPQGTLTKGKVLQGPVLPRPNFQSPPQRKGSSKSTLQFTKGKLVTVTRVRGSLPGVFSSQTSRDIGIPIAKRISPTDMEFADAIQEILITMSSPSRWKRTTHRANQLGDRSWHRLNHRVPRGTVLPHFAPGNIFDTRLVSCRPGSKRDVNAKCRDTILPSRSPRKPRPAMPSSAAAPPTGAGDTGRQSRSAPPVSPRPSCPPGKSYNLQRLCEPTSAAINSISANKLG